MCRCLRGAALGGETRGTVAGGAHDVIARGKQVHAAAVVGAGRAHVQRLVGVVSGPHCDHLWALKYSSYQLSSFCITV